MERPNWRIAKANPKAIIPTKEIGNSGYDVYTVQEEDVILLQGEKCNLDSGLKMEIDQEWGIIFHEKGGFGNKNLSLRAGLTDSNYRGNLIILLTNLDAKPCIFTRNPKKYDVLKDSGKFTIYDLNKSITQIILVPTPHVVPEVVTEEELTETDRGEGRFGSTGK